MKSSDAPGDRSVFAHGKAAAWLLVLILVCAGGWRASSRTASHVWQHPEQAMCNGVPRFESLVATLPDNSDVLFVGPEPRDAAGADFFEYFRRFFCVQYALAPAVLHPVYAPSLLTQDRARTARAFVIDTRRDHAEIQRSLAILASRRGQSVSETVVAPDLVVASFTGR